MLIVKNKFIPFGNYKAINLFGILFCKKNALIDDVTVNHEKIHTAQMLEMLFIPYYIWYGVEYLIELFKYKTNKSTYKHISFEEEAYGNQYDMEYLKHRKLYAWTKYL